MKIGNWKSQVNQSRTYCRVWWKWFWDFRKWFWFNIWIGDRIYSLSRLCSCFYFRLWNSFFFLYRTIGGSSSWVCLCWWRKSLATPCCWEKSLSNLLQFPEIDDKNRILNIIRKMNSISASAKTNECINVPSSNEYLYIIRKLFRGNLGAQELINLF